MNVPSVLYPMVAVVVAGSLLGCALRPSNAAPTVNRAQRDLQRIERELHAYRSATGQWPDNGEGLRALVRNRRLPGRRSADERPPPRDPWGRQYQYRYSPALDRISIWSFGEDVINSADDIRIDRSAGLSR